MITSEQQRKVDILYIQGRGRINSICKIMTKFILSDEQTNKNDSAKISFHPFYNSKLGHCVNKNLEFTRGKNN